MITKRLEKKISKFLEKKVRTKDTGYPEVTDRELSDLYDIFRAIIDAKWELDCDGDSVISFDIIDHSQFESLHFRQIKHLHKLLTNEEREERFQDITSNLRTCCDKLCNELSIRKSHVLNKSS